MTEIRCCICNALLRQVINAELARFFKFKRYECPRHRVATVEKKVTPNFGAWRSDEGSDHGR